MRPRLSHARVTVPIVTTLIVALWLLSADRLTLGGDRAAANEPPLGVIDAPLEGTTMTRSITVNGWAGDDRGIREIRVFVDGRLAAFAAFVRQRPDVSLVYPRFRHGTDRHGWETVVDGVAAGPRLIRVEAVDSDGISSELGIRRVLVAGSSR